MLFVDLYYQHVEEVALVHTNLTRKQYREELYNKILQQIPDFVPQTDAAVVPFVRQKMWWVAAAAIFLITLSTGLFYHARLEKPTRTAEIATVPASTTDIAPGGTQATLTLAGGSTVVLRDAANGFIGIQGETAIRKTEDGQLVYQASETSLLSTQPLYNTLTTPRGGEYSLTLPDGSRVWLNSASSLQFPVSFTGKERHVKLTGEAYFEVAKDEGRPFTVSVNDVRVEVLGTHFNIMAYENEAQLKTTLLKGSVKVIKGGTAALLKPGQQATVGASAAMNVEAADLNKAVAWKNGYFHFHRDGIADIMKQLSRWYDVDVAYEGQIPQDEFIGKIRRGVTLSQALKMLEISGVRFKIEGRKIIVKG